jgi:hypothetical protein
VAVDQFALGGDEVERDVPVLLVDLGQFLERVGDADQQRFGGAHLLVEKREAAVVVAAAVAEPTAATFVPMIVRPASPGTAFALVTISQS